MVTLPINSSSSALSPCLPMTIRSQSSSCSCSTIRQAGSPCTTTCRASPSPAASLKTASCSRASFLMTLRETSKLDAITIVLAGTASAIVGVYVGRVISNAMAGVPLLNNFNSQISSVLTGVLVTAVPLAAIYTFDQNKNKLTFVTSRFAKSRDADEAVPT
ncbi:hypothetical protein EMIT053CA3_40173 [Pseudomonas donghuensis]